MKFSRLSCLFKFLFYPRLSDLKKRKKIGTVCVFSSLFFFFEKLVSHSLWTTSVHEELCILKPKKHIFLRLRNVCQDQVKVKISMKMQSLYFLWITVLSQLG